MHFSRLQNSFLKQVFFKDVQSTFFIKRRENKVLVSAFTNARGPKQQSRAQKLELKKITSASKAARQGGELEEGRHHVARSWPPPRLPAQELPA
jgi:hypothetical protein